MANGDKHTFVFGAGFSWAAQYPLQNGLLDRIEAIRLASVPLPIANSILDDRNVVLEFLGRAGLRRPDVPLEDIFTLIDETVTLRGFYRGYTWRDLDEISQAFQRCISYVLNEAETSIHPAALSSYHQFAEWVVRTRCRSGQKSDPIALITLNWDGLVERSIYAVKPRTKDVDVDFCCYTSPMDGSPHMPSVKQKAAEVFNIKLLKLHGSCNWLRCANCQCVFTGIGALRSPVEMYTQRTACPQCSRAQEQYVPELDPMLIMPTFRKAFDNAHFRGIWHNAHIELSETAKLTIIGYSLPDADYSLRALLKRSVKPGIPVTVVLAPADNPKSASGRRRRGVFAESRYQSVFRSTNPLSFNYEGFERYVRRHCL